MSEKKSLAELFGTHATTEANSTTVSEKFYQAEAANQGIDADTINAVNKFNQDFMATSLTTAQDTLVNTIGDGDGSSVIFDTGTEGFTFQHHINKDETTESGWDIYSVLENNLGGDSELASAYEACHNALSELSEEEEGEE